MSGRVPDPALLSATAFPPTPPSAPDSFQPRSVDTIQFSSSLLPFRVDSLHPRGFPGTSSVTSPLYPPGSASGPLSPPPKLWFKALKSTFSSLPRSTRAPPPASTPPTARSRGLLLPRPPPPRPCILAWVPPGRAYPCVHFPGCTWLAEPTDCGFIWAHTFHFHCLFPVSRVFSPRGLT